MRILILLMLWGFAAAVAQAQSHARNVQQQRRHAAEMNRQGYLNSQRQFQGQAGAPAPDPVQWQATQTEYMIELARMRTKQLISAADAMHELASDPRFQRLAVGYWAHYQEGDPPAPGQKCIATYTNMDGMLSVAALGGYKDPALLLLAGMDVPKPEKEVTIRATLHQTGAQPQKVSVQNFTQEAAGLGTVAFAVPSLEAAIEGTIEELELAVDVEGERIYKLKYRDGEQARAALEKCARMH